MALVALGMDVQSWQIMADHGPITSYPAGAVMTEKDAARLPPQADIWALRMELVVEGAEPLLEAIRNAVH